MNSNNIIGDGSSMTLKLQDEESYYAEASQKDIKLPILDSLQSKRSKEKAAMNQLSNRSRKMSQPVNEKFDPINFSPIR